jgi:hypothetical protein
MLKLGVQVTEKSTGLTGMLIHMQVQTNNNRFYNFQPRGLNPETGQPLKRRWCPSDRFEGGVEIPEKELPLEVLGTHVEDVASGFNGTATALTLHINGCVHVTIQPAGTQPKNGEIICENEFDIRLLKGDAIKPLTADERSASEKEKPSPIESGSCSPREM